MLLDTFAYTSEPLAIPLAFDYMTEGMNSELRDFWWRVLSALSRLAALGMFMAVHFLLNHGFEFIVPSDMAASLRFIQDIVYVVFVLVYVYLAFDMLTVFVPRLKGPV